MECSYDPSEGHPGQLVYTLLIRIQRLTHTFQHSLSDVTLDIYLDGFILDTLKQKQQNV
jgi:hypothetical protein